MIEEKKWQGSKKKLGGENIFLVFIHQEFFINFFTINHLIE